MIKTYAFYSKIILFLFLIIPAFGMHAQEFNWATHVTGEEFEYGIKAIKDAAGNTYILGYSTGNPMVYEGVSYPASGRSDAFFAKLDASKNLVWMKTAGGNDPNYMDDALDMHMDPFGDLYLTFKSSGNNFTYNGQVLSGINSPGQYSGEGVLIKVNADGDYLWHDSGSTSSSFQGITTDAAGNLYLTGYFGPDMTLGGAITLSNPSTGTTTDFFIAKYQPNGTILWAKRGGGMPHNTFAYGYDVEIHPQTNEIMVLAKGDGEVFFDGIPMPIFEGSDRACLLISYSADGTLNWLKRILDLENNGFSYGNSLDISASGIMGVCADTGGSDAEALVGFYTSNGSVISEHTYPSTGSVKTYSIAFNEFNEAYVSGFCITDAVLGMSPGTVNLSATTGFIAKMDLQQQVKWVMQFAATSFYNTLHYENEQLLYAGRIDSNFVYNNGQEVIVNDAGDALFGEVIDYELPLNRCNITGTIFQDLDANCVLDVADVRQPSVIVKAVGDNGTTHFSVSDANGYYDIPVTTGTYTVEILPNPVQSDLIGQTCYTQQEVVLTTLGQDVNDINFPIELSECPLLYVDVSSDRRRRCFESNTYVNYGNSGFADAENVEVMVQLPEYVSFISSSHPHTIDADGNYVFNVGTLAPNQSGVIHIVDITQCIEGITGLTQCTEVWITPENNCADELDPNYDEWDYSSIKVSSSCLNNTTIQFAISNTAQPGVGDMENPHEYRIYVDNALAVTSTFQLNGSETLIVDYPANGQTVRLEADQHPFHPGNSHPQQTVEGCGSTDGEASRGYVNRMPMDDEDIDVEIDCLEIIDSYDPNDKAVSPTGITDNHYIEAGTVLDYLIRFQNTGTDVAYTVVVKDSLSEYLNPATIRWGTSSHPYTISMSGTDNPVLEFRFDNINLPDSTANEPASHGFVKFKASTYGALANGTVINNNANIYFDYNLPILTNTAQTTISDIVLVYDPLSIEPAFANDIKLYPNPTSGYLFIEAINFEHVEIYNLSGVHIQTLYKKDIDLSQYATGMYVIKIKTDKGTAVKKIILK